MFDFIQQYPKLFPEHLRDPALREQFIKYMAEVFAARNRIDEILLAGRPHLVAFGHWNANIDNCWFERDVHDVLQCGFIHWANCGQLPLTQIVAGVLTCAGPRFGPTISMSFWASSSRSSRLKVPQR